MQVPTLPEHPPSTKKVVANQKFNRGDPKTENARAKPRAPRVSRGAELKIAVERIRDYGEELNSTGERGCLNSVGKRHPVKSIGNMRSRGRIFQGHAGCDWSAIRRSIKFGAGAEPTEKSTYTYGRAPIQTI